MARNLFDIARLASFIDAGHTMLTPNLRLARRIKAEWDKQQSCAGATVWEPLPVYPLDQWLHGQWQRAVRLGLLPSLLPLSHTQELMLWQQVITDNVTTQAPLTLLRPAAAAELMSEARDMLARWRVDLSPGLRSVFALETDCAAFLEWQSLFERRLRASNQCTRSDCLLALAEVAAEMDSTPICLIDCADIPPLLEACLHGLGGEVAVVPAPVGSARCVAHPFPDQRSELAGVAAWAAQMQRDAPSGTLGIVLSNTGVDRVTLEYLLRREFDCLGDNYQSLPVNFSTGISLSQAPVIRDALAVLSLALSQTTTSSVLALLQSRFIGQSDRDNPLLLAFIQRLCQYGARSLPVSEVRDAVNAVAAKTGGGNFALAERLLSISGMRALRRDLPPSEWVEHFNALLAEWRWPGEAPLDSLEFQQVARWYQTLDEFCALDAIWPAVSYAQALQLLQECCARQVSQPQTSDAPVQVLGPLEAVGLSFDHLWVLGMQGNAWPGPARPNPFIPLSLQARLQMPHATPEREWDYSEQLLARYRRSCGCLHASYSQQIDGVVDLPSAFLEAFEAKSVADSYSLDARWLAACEAASREAVDDSTAPALSEQERSSLRGGASLLEHQSQCPFRGFARNRLHVEPPSEYSPGMQPSERGTVVHGALHKLWQELGDHSTLLRLDAQALEPILARATRAGLNELASRRRQALGRACIELEAVRLRSLLQEWLKVERERGAFSIALLEEDLQLELSGLTIKLRVDRIDALPDGGRVVIDYKTGKARFADWLGVRPARPQLLLYGLLGEEPPAALAFAQVRPRDSAYDGLGITETIPGVKTDIAKAVEDKMPADDWSSLNAVWKDNLERLAQEFIDGRAEVDPLRNSCMWCGLQPLCRIEAPVDDIDEARE